MAKKDTEPWVVATLRQYLAEYGLKSGCYREMLLELGPLILIADIYRTRGLADRLCAASPDLVVDDLWDRAKKLRINPYLFSLAKELGRRQGTMDK